MKIKILMIPLALIFSALLIKYLTPSVKADTPQYTITDLGVLSGTTTSQAFSINNEGQIVGRSSNNQGSDDQAFLWQGGKMTELPTLGDAPTVAYGINDKGQIVGGSKTSIGTPSAVMWQNNTIQDLGTLSPSAGNSLALAINSNSQVVGWSAIVQQNNSVGHAFSWINNGMLDLNTATQSSSTALSVNDKGQVVGWAVYPDGVGYPEPVLWQNGIAIRLGLLTSSAYHPNSIAQAINDNGQIVGEEDINNSTVHAVLWQNGHVTDLGTLGGSYSYALGINNNGVIVGASETTNNVDLHAVIWQNGQIYDLGTLGGQNSFAWAINDNNQIVGYAYTASGATHAALWSPPIPSPTPLPLQISLNNPISASYLHSQSFQFSYSISGGQGVTTSSATLDGKPLLNNTSVDLFYQSLGKHRIIITASDSASNNKTLSAEFTVTATIDSTISDITKSYNLHYIKNKGLKNMLITEFKQAKKQENILSGRITLQILRNLVQEINHLPNSIITSEGKNILISDINYIIQNKSF